MSDGIGAGGGAYFYLLPKSREAVPVPQTYKVVVPPHPNQSQLRQQQQQQQQQQKQGNVKLPNLRVNVNPKFNTSASTVNTPSSTNSNSSSSSRVKNLPLYPTSSEGNGFLVGSSRGSTTGSGLGSRNVSPSKLPSFDVMTSSPDIAAGVPVLELVRKMEEERILNREDRIALSGALYDPLRRDKLVLALRDVELGTNPRFAVRRLKVLIHQNMGGEPSSQAQHEQQLQQHQPKEGEEIRGNFQFDVNSDEGNNNNKEVNNDNTNMGDQVESADSFSSIPIHGQLLYSNQPQNQNQIMDMNAALAAPRPRILHSDKSRNRNNNSDLDDISVTSSIIQVSATISQVVGETPMYSGPDTVCNKITRRLRDFLTKYKAVSQGPRKLAVIVGSGSCNPITRMHMRTFFLAKQYLEQRAGFIVLGSLLTPAHGASVRERYRQHPSEIIPSPHRLAIAQLLVQESKWLSVDPWEITRRRSMDYIALLEHTAEMLKERFPDIDEIKVIYLCKGNMIPKISPQILRSQSFGCVCVSRPPECDQLRASLSAKWNGLIWVVEDAAILDSNLDIVSSRTVREKIKSGEPIAQFLGDTVEGYIRQHKIGIKMNGEEKWTAEEKRLPEISARPFEPLHMTKTAGVSSSSGSLYLGNTTPSLASQNYVITTPSSRQMTLSPSVSASTSVSLPSSAQLIVATNITPNENT